MTEPQEPIEEKPEGGISLADQVAALRGQLEQVRQIASIARVEQEFSTGSDGNGPDIGPGEWFTSGGLNTTAYIYGEAKTLSPAATDKWIVVNLATGNITYSVSDPSDPFPANEEWYEIANTSGTIRIVNH